jgi:hypothetical protein
MLPILIDENFNQRILRGLQARLSELDYLIAQKTHLLGKDDPEVLLIGLMRGSNSANVDLS